ncbi:MAG: hypothetical protein V7636_319 [Actinomycetota bacterium]
MSVTELDSAAADLVIDLRDAALAPISTEATAPPLAIAAELTVPSPRYLRHVKPVVDRVAAALILLLVLPALALTALAVRVSMGKGVLYRQVRVGRDGRPFEVLKFRTMLHDRREGGTGSWDSVDRRLTHKTDLDPRHTPVGRFLRKWSLDELPQLVNVLKGEMSIVGPRPELVSVVSRYAPWEHGRHVVKPGLTGLWQIRARSEGPMHAFTHMDLEYVRSVSPLIDLKIVLLTIPAALGAQKGS